MLINLKSVYFVLLLVCLLAAACSPQAEQSELPTLAVLPTDEPATEPPTAPPATATVPPPTAAPTEPVEEAAQAVTEEAEAPAIAADSNGTIISGGEMIPGCDDWQSWDISRLELRDSIYSQPVANAAPADIPRLQLEQLRAGVGAMDYNECLAEARFQYLNALDEALLALAAPDRATADQHEQLAADALAAFDSELALLGGN